MKTEKQLISELKKWLKKDGNSALLIAMEIGYKSSTAVNMWLSRDSIPVWVRPKLEQFITEKERKNEQVESGSEG